jgi:hypothetical protein
MLKKVDGKWALVSRKTQRPLAYYRGEGKPSDEWVQKQERRIQFFKHGGIGEEKIQEASYPGNIGMMEVFKFFQIATENQKKKFNDLVKSKKEKEAWDFMQKVTGIKLHPVKTVKEEISPDILPKAGAGQDGTDTLVKSYTRDTPGQSFKAWKKKHTK